MIKSTLDISLIQAKFGVRAPCYVRLWVTSDTLKQLSE